MHEAVLAGFPSFTQKCEGRELHPYLDKDGAVTTGVGILCNTVATFCAIPWRIDGALADREMVVASFNDLRAQTRLAQLGARAAASVTKLRITDADCDALTLARMRGNEALLEAQFLDWARLPADCQCAIHSLSWARGAAHFDRDYPKFFRAVNARDWPTAWVECLLDDSNNAGLTRRNEQNRVCLRNAQVVDSDVNHAGRARGTHALRIDTLYWPLELQMTPENNS